MNEARRVRLVEPYPMVRVTDRALTAADAGAVHVWDIDRTYLDTRFSQLKHLVGTFFELAIDKRDLPGTVELLHALRNGPTGREHRPLYFVSASPPQLARAVERKMLLDGVEWDGIAYKDQARLLGGGNVSQLREQVGFKLAALLALAAELPDGARLHLYGDDLEKDPLIYCLFADAAAGRLRSDALAAAIASQGTRPRYVAALVRQAAATPPRDLVAGVHIRLERAPDGATIARYDARVRGYATWGAAARSLAGDGLISADAAEHVVAVAGDAPIRTGKADTPADGAWLPMATKP